MYNLKDFFSVLIIFSLGLGIKVLYASSPDHKGSTDKANVVMKLGFVMSSLVSTRDINKKDPYDNSDRSTKRILPLSHLVRFKGSSAKNKLGKQSNSMMCIEKNINSECEFEYSYSHIKKRLNNMKDGKETIIYWLKSIDGFDISQITEQSIDLKKVLPEEMYTEDKDRKERDVKQFVYQGDVLSPSEKADITFSRNRVLSRQLNS